MNQRKGTIFISCGQFTNDEKQLGKDIVELVQNLTPYEPYFAEFQQGLEALTENIFNKLDEMVGFITVMHKRGSVFFDDPNNAISRGSVWVEQEIAIASFLVQSHKRSIAILPFIEEGIKREGVRDILVLNPVPFARNEQVLKHLKKALPIWQVPQSPTAEEGEPLSETVERVRNRGLQQVPSVKEWGLLWMLAIPNPSVPRNERLFDIAQVRKAWYGKKDRTCINFTSQDAAQMHRNYVETKCNVGKQPIRHLMFEANGSFSAFQLLDVQKDYISAVETKEQYKHIHSGYVCKELHNFLLSLEEEYSHHISSIKQVTVQLRLEYCKDYAFTYEGFQPRDLRDWMIHREDSLEPFERTVSIDDLVENSRDTVIDIITELFNTFNIPEPRFNFAQEQENPIKVLQRRWNAIVTEITAEGLKYGVRLEIDDGGGNEVIVGNSAGLQPPHKLRIKKVAEDLGCWVTFKD